jgi:cytoskeletal protein CcmA (bactofilin family)
MALKLFHRHAKDPERWTGFIDQGVKVEGRLELGGIFRIDGVVKGTILSERSLILGENSKVEGQIEGNAVAIAGHFDGIIFAKVRVEIHPKAVVTGEIHTPCLVLQPGAVFDGTCHMLSSAAPAKTITIPIRSSAGQA